MPKTTKQAKPLLRLSVRKVVIVHKRALVGKYGVAGYAKIKSALDAMVLDDRSRGISTRIALVDAKVPAGGVSATVPSKAGKFKAAVDSIYKDAKQPDYLILLGGPDVIPHIPLHSPWGNAAPFGEEDVVDSDLPYASSHRHTLDASKFLDAPRQVGRIPDVPGASDAAYLINRIQEAMKAPTLDAKQHFSLTADVWKGASTEIVTRLFGAGAKLHCCPTLGPVWASNILKKPFQYINCHGDTRKAVFYGERAGVAGSLPHAINTAALAKKVAPGAVVVAECCYGAELFEPRLPNEPQGMALSYLEQGATTFLGSSTVSYGGVTAVDLACADELCLFFLEGILDGASCGQALADARRRLVQNQTVIDNYQIKTLAQFMLLGDPARQPVRVAAKKMAKKTAAARSAKGSNTERYSDGPRAAPLRKTLGTVPVANQNISVDQDRLMQSIPMPPGVAYSATLFAPAGEQVGARSSSPKMKSLAKKSRIEKPSVLVVSIPNDPDVIAAMRQAWDRVEVGTTRVVRSVAPKMAIMQEVPALRAKTTSLTEFAALYAWDPNAVPSDPPKRYGRSYALARRASTPPQIPERGDTTAAAGAERPERNRHVAMVARIANGQIQTYKVIVAR
jgi:hypothetical protein